MSIKLMVEGKVIPYVRTKFAGGEIHVNTDCDVLGAVIKADLRDSDSIMELLLLSDALRHNGVLYLAVELSYLPYARQDRVCTPGDAFSLSVMAKLINQAKFDLVYIDDPHSDVATKLIDHSVGLPQSALVGHVNLPPNTVFVAPDKGAIPKTVALAKYHKVPYYFASKVRDPALRNTVIGTLICDLDEGVSVEAAVAKFESKMDGYKRTTAIASPKQIANANARVIELGLNDSLARRYAESDDLTINNVLFADVSVQESMGVLADALTAFSVAKPKLSGEPLKMGVEEFLRDVLPVSTGIEVNFDNAHQNRLMSVIAPVNAEAPKLFKWDNGFSWTYNGELADSMRDRVKAAGGKVDGQLRASLAWDYSDDLDIHVHQPRGARIYHQTKGRACPRTGGMLDVDANYSSISESPVENVTWPDLRKIPKGDVVIMVDNYRRRSSGIGFVLEIDIMGKTVQFNYDKVVKVGPMTVVATLVSDGMGNVVIDERRSLPFTGVTNEVWGINTLEFHKVNMVMKSPNHWDGEKTGNEHLFFIMDTCVNPDTARGFYNEFLRDELSADRKVFEMLGSKLRAPTSEKQLSGLGFSSTQPAKVLVKVQGKINRLIELQF